MSDRITVMDRGVVQQAAAPSEIYEFPRNGEAHVTVRPGKVRFGACGDNVLAARVTDILYLGASSQHTVELPGGDRLTLLQQNSQDAPGVPVGERVRTVWDASHCLLPVRSTVNIAIAG